MGYLGNQYYSPNTILGCTSNVEYRLSADNTFFDNISISESHKDTLIYRDSL